MKKCPKCSGALVLIEMVMITRMYRVNPETGVHDPVPYAVEQSLEEGYTLCTECEVKHANGRGNDYENINS